MFADAIAEAAGTSKDVMGNFHLIVDSIAKAQRFVIGDDVTAAATELLASKPSTLLSALPLCRVPYPNLWLEWRGEHPLGKNLNAPLREHSKPVKRMGCWITSYDKGTKGSAFWVWEAPDGDISCGGLGIVFSLTEKADAIYRMFDAKIPTPNIAEARRLLKKRFAAKLLDQEAVALDEIAAHCAAFPCPWMIPLLVQLEANGVGPNTQRYAQLMEMWSRDISGELPFVLVLLMLMNTKNGVAQTPCPDLSKLNRARAKARKPLKFDYVTTTLAISRGQARLGKARGLTDQEIRRHCVRGHFKMRSSGIFWWSSFIRGSGRSTIRDRYEVRT